MKLYADEPQAEEVRELRPLLVARLARVEVPAAIWRKQRLGELGAEEAGALTRQFEHDWLGPTSGTGRFAVVALTDAVLNEAATLCATDGLRGYDAVQLAAAAAARLAVPTCDSFACFDRELREAAARNGFVLVPQAAGV